MRLAHLAFTRLSIRQVISQKRNLDGAAESDHLYRGQILY